jgi:NTP pyrophosphatase (non-canonical NTP hydrolase)
MNRQQHLLIKIMEECGEIQQAASKALLFGLDDGYPGTDRKNITDLGNELNDLAAVVDMLTTDGLDLHADEKRIYEKKAKVEHWMLYSSERGILSV